MGARRRIAVAAGAGACALLSLTAGASAQPCAQPNAPAATVQAVEPRYPEDAQRQDVSGSVFVVVSLDEQSRATNVAVQQSPSRLLNDAALEAARNSVFRTAVRDCRPVRADYLFVVTFSPHEPQTSVIFGGGTTTPTVTVVAVGSARREPDLATLILGFEWHAAYAQAASDAGRAAFADFRKTARGIGLPDAAVIDGSMSVFQQGPNDYLAWRTATIHATPGVQALTTGQAAAASGATFASVQYSVTASRDVYAEALEAARRAADVSARDAASGRGLVLGDAVSSEPLVYHEYPLGEPATYQLTRDAPSIPDPPATLRARAAVRVTYALHR